MARIFVVDDEAPIKNLLHRFLVSFGHEVESTVSYEKAVDRIKIFSPALVISDIDIFGYDGRSFITLFPDMKIIFISGNKDNEVPEKYLLIAKPFSLKDILKAVEKVLGEKE